MRDVDVWHRLKSIIILQKGFLRFEKKNNFYTIFWKRYSRLLSSSILQNIYISFPNDFSAKTIVTIKTLIFEKISFIVFFENA